MLVSEQSRAVHSTETHFSVVTDRHIPEDGDASHLKSKDSKEKQVKGSRVCTETK